MRRLALDPEAAHQLGRRGQAIAQERLSQERLSAVVRQRLGRWCRQQTQPRKPLLQSPLPRTEAGCTGLRRRQQGQHCRLIQAVTGVFQQALPTGSIGVPHQSCCRPGPAPAPPPRALPGRRRRRSGLLPLRSSVIASAGSGLSSTRRLRQVSGLSIHPPGCACNNPPPAPVDSSHGGHHRACAQARNCGRDRPGGSNAARQPP